MNRNEDGDLIISKETQEIAKEILATLGFVYVTTRILYFILAPGKING
jgi:hypothetical protein